MPAPSDGEIANETLLVRALIDQIPDFLFVKDTENRFVIANRAVAAAYGVSPDALVGKTDFDLHPVERAQAFFDFERQVIGQGLSLTNMEESFPDSDGIQRWYSTNKVPLRDPTSRVVGLVGIARDITERKQAESLMVQQGLILELIARNAPMAPVLNRLCLLVESQMHGIKATILPADPENQKPGHQPGPAGGLFVNTISRAETMPAFDIQADPPRGAPRDLATASTSWSSWSTPIMAHDGVVLGTFTMYSAEARPPNEIETRLIAMSVRLAGIAMERHRSEDRIRFIAHHDALTGLPNRTVLQDRLAEAVLRATEGDAAVCVVLIDLDNFKMVNDGLGHVAGDKLLKMVATRMLACVRPCDTVIRLGGDEFVLILSDERGRAQDIIPLLEKVKDTLAHPIEIDERHFQVSCSMGIAVYPDDGDSVETLLKNADAAMYSAKAEGGDKLRFYTPAMNQKVLERLYLHEQLRKAIERSELTLVYQPQLDLRTRRVFGVEALLRWKHPTLGNVSPATFIPIAEDSGLIVPIGEWALRTACRQNRAWQDAGIGPVVVSVNVSARQFRERTWTARVAAALADSGLPAEFLELELTESMLMNDLARAIVTMRELTDLGVRLSVDDFGTGYSSLSALKRFPVCRLKIDQSFVRDLAEDDNDKAITAAVISMGRSLGLRVLAEGVETEEQFAFLVGQDCDEMQGYLFSRPVAPREVQRMLEGAPAAAGAGGRCHAEALHDR